MDTTLIIAFLTGGSLVASLLVGLFKKFLKSVNDRYGALATQCLLLIICVAIAGIAWATQYLPVNFVATVAIIWAGAMALYEVGYKAVLQQLVMGKTE